MSSTKESNKIILDGRSFPDIMKSHNYKYPQHFKSAWDDFTHNVPTWEKELFEKFKGKDNLLFFDLKGNIPAILKLFPLSSFNDSPRIIIPPHSAYMKPFLLNSLNDKRLFLALVI